MYLTRSGLSRPFSTSPIKSFQHWSQLFFMPCLKADFAISHTSRSRRSPFERVNLRRAERHSRRRTDNWSFHQYIKSLVRPCPQRGIEWLHAATTFRLAARTVSSNDPADFAQPSSSRLNVKSLPRFNTIRSFLVTISPTKIPLLPRRASPYSGDLLLKSPAIRDRLLASLRLSSGRSVTVC